MDVNFFNTELHNTMIDVKKFRKMRNDGNTEILFLENWYESLAKRVGRICEFLITTTFLDGLDPNMELIDYQMLTICEMNTEEYGKMLIDCWDDGQIEGLLTFKMVG